jgi:hypothetical protein
MQWLYGRCRKHFRDITDPATYEQLKNVSSPEDRLALFNRLIQPPPPTKWEYENPEGEAELMRLNAEPNETPVLISQEKDDASRTE